MLTVISLTALLCVTSPTLAEKSTADRTNQLPDATPNSKPAAKTLKLGFRTEKITDAILKAKLAGMTDWENVYLSFAHITDEGVKELARSKNLRELDLHWCFYVTDTGLKDLAASCKKLEFLGLD